MTIEQYNFAGKKAIVRVDFNVPLDENGKITDPYPRCPPNFEKNSCRRRRSHNYVAHGQA